MLCVCTKRVCVCNTELVCKAVQRTFSCHTSAIALPFISIPWFDCTIVNYVKILHVMFEQIKD